MRIHRRRQFAAFLVFLAIGCAGCATAEDESGGSPSPKAKTRSDVGAPEGGFAAPDEAGISPPSDGGSSDTAADDTEPSDTGDPDTGDPEADPPDTDPGPPPPPPDPGDGGGVSDDSCTTDADCSTPFDCCDTTIGFCGLKVFGFCVAP